jgi:hypothetical protein
MLYRFLETLKTQEMGTAAAVQRLPHYSSTAAVSLFMRRPNTLDEIQRAHLAAFCLADPSLDTTYRLAQDFLVMMRQREGELCWLLGASVRQIEGFNQGSIHRFLVWCSLNRENCSLHHHGESLMETSSLCVTLFLHGLLKPASLLFPIRDDRPYPVAKCWISPTQDGCVDEGNDNDPETTPREEVRRCRLPWLHECPQWKANRQHPEKRQDQMFHQRELFPVVSPVVHGQRQNARDLLRGNNERDLCY